MKSMSISVDELVCKLKSSDKYEAINELIEKTPLGNYVKNIDRLKDAVIQREKEQSTGIGGGIAVAHGKCSEVDSVYIALGISKKGIEFDSFDEQPVHLLLLFSNPPHMEREYLQALSLIMRVLINQPIRRKNAVHKNIKKVKNRLLNAFQEVMCVGVDIS